MNFQDIPIIFEVLESEHLKPISSHVEGDRIVCKDKSGNKFFMKDCRGIEEKIFQAVFPAIRQQNLNFSLLKLPDYKSVITWPTQPNSQSQRQFIFLNYYDGITFNDKWNETNPHSYGGRALDVSMADKVLNLLQDFALIDLSLLSTFNLPTFDFNSWKTNNFPIYAASLVQHGSLTQDHINQADIILNPSTLFQGSQMIITNGDFYPRNFIELPSGKTVVIDWEGREREHVRVNGGAQAIASQRNAFINFIENHAAFFFVHMWGSHAIQKKFIKTTAQTFNLTPENLQAAILIKSLEQGAAFGGGYPSHREAEIFVHALDINYIHDLLL